MFMILILTFFASVDGAAVHAVCGDGDKCNAVGNAGDCPNGNVCHNVNGSNAARQPNGEKCTGTTKYCTNGTDASIQCVDGSVCQGDGTLTGATHGAKCAATTKYCANADASTITQCVVDDVCQKDGTLVGVAPHGVCDGILKYCAKADNSATTLCEDKKVCKTDGTLGGIQIAAGAKCSDTTSYCTNGTDASIVCVDGSVCQKDGTLDGVAPHGVCDGILKYCAKADNSVTNICEDKKVCKTDGTLGGIQIAAGEKCTDDTSYCTNGTDASNVCVKDKYCNADGTVTEKSDDGDEQKEDDKSDDKTDDKDGAMQIGIIGSMMITSVVQLM